MKPHYSKMVMHIIYLGPLGLTQKVHIWWEQNKDAEELVISSHFTFMYMYDQFAKMFLLKEVSIR